MPKGAEEAIRPLVKDFHVFYINSLSLLFRLLMNIFGKKPFQVAYFYSGRIHQKLNELINQIKPHHLYCQLIRTAEYIRHHEIDKTIDYQDVFSKGLLRRKEIAPWHLKPVLNVEYKRVKEYEAEVFNDFNKKTIITYPDRDLICHTENERIHVIPNGVDTVFFHPIEMEKDYDIIFSGNMGYPPNINGAEYLVHKIMPLVWKEKSGAKLIIAGSTPSARVKSLSSDRVWVTGWVDDIRHLYARSKVFVAPMQIGTGLQNKVLEAMAMHLPVVTSPLANLALRAAPGKDLLIGNNPSEYAQHILSLLNNQRLHKELKIRGFDFINKHFQWESSCKRLEIIITSQMKKETS
jgi:glycosyltransferase involved in cell wall biosynthesis